MPPKTKKKVRQYSAEYLKFGFIAAPHDERLPHCLLCEQTLCNDSMKPVRLENHLKQRHSEHSQKNLSFFTSLKSKYLKQRPKTIQSFINSRKNVNDRGLLASYEISLLIAKNGKPHTIGENLIKPALSIFVKTVLQRSDDEVPAVPLSNNVVCSRMEEMVGCAEKQLVDMLKTRPFTVQLDETTVRNSEALLLAYVRYIENGEFH